MAFKIEEAVSFSNEKSKRKTTPSQAPGSVRPRTMMASIRTKSVGMRYFERRSIPCSTPAITTPQVSERKTRCQAVLRVPSETSELKWFLSISASVDVALPVKASTR